MDAPLFSIVVPTFNSEERILKCLQGIARQEYNEFEVIVQDGMSKDNTAKLVREFSSANSNVSIRLFEEKDSGIYDAMNKGIEHASGKWLLFLGSDDELHDESVLQDVADFLKKKDAEIVYGDAKISGDNFWAKDGTVYDGQFDYRKLLDKNICHQAIFFRKDVFERYGNYNLKYKIWADWEFNLRVFNSAKCVYQDRIISNFATGGVSSTNTDWEFYYDKPALIKSYFHIGYLNSYFRNDIMIFRKLSRDFFVKKQWLKCFENLLPFCYFKIRNQFFK